MSKTGTHSDGMPVIAYCVRRAGGAALAERLADEEFYAAVDRQARCARRRSASP